MRKRVLSMIMAAAMTAAAATSICASAAEVPEDSGATQILGDVNSNGKVTSDDALTILRMSVGTAAINSTTKPLADIDGDGKITAGDGLHVLRYTAKLPVQYAVGQAIGTQPTGSWKNMSANDYSKLIAGNLTQEQLKLVLSYYPADPYVTKGVSSKLKQVSNPQSIYLLGFLSEISNNGDKYGLHYYGYQIGSNGGSKYSVSELNRLFASFSDFQLTDSVFKNTSDHIDGDILYYNGGVTITYDTIISIKEAKYNGSKMTINYTYTVKFYRNGDRAQLRETYTADKTAAFTKGSGGLYKITEVTTNSSSHTES